MDATLSPSKPTSLTLHFGPILKKMTEREFFEFCQANRDLRIERTRDGDLIIMPPTGGNTGRRNAILNHILIAWAEVDGSGIVFDSSTGFTLPNGAIRAPDLAWVRLERWKTLTEGEQEEFPPLCPDFVAELRSPSDRLDVLQDKMQEYIENGAQLGWLIDPFERKTHIYRPGTHPVVLDNPETISGAPVLSGFVLGVRQLWS